jgi:hypothetical protein
LAGLAKNIGERLRVLRRRELENYLLHPGAILARIRSRTSTDGSLQKRLSTTTLDDIQRLIDHAADALYAEVVARSIVAELGVWLPYLNRDDLVVLIADTESEGLPKAVSEAAILGAEKDLRRADIEREVTKIIRKLNKSWKLPSNHQQLAPGQEILTSVFREFGLRYSKRTDTPQLAMAIPLAAIDPEIVDLIRDAAALGGL